MLATQQASARRAFSSPTLLCQAACDRARVTQDLATALEQAAISAVLDVPHRQLLTLLTPRARELGLSDSAVVKVADNVQLLRAFAKPDVVIEQVRAKVERIVDSFPRAAADLECGRNPGDVMDPFLLGATQFLLCGGSIDQGLEATVSHKCMMMIENLVGNLHQDVIGSMRTNIRAPEPKGESWDLIRNPFPGADVLQLPDAPGEPLRFFQVKSKTGSAKGGDGIRLGQQFDHLVKTFGGEIHYVAVVGTTLKGHRSMAGVLGAYPTAIVTVGQTALQLMTRSPVGGELLLRVYQTAFRDVAHAKGYTVREVASAIAAEFRRKFSAGDDDLLDGILRDVTKGPASEQDSRLYQPPRGRR